MADAWWHSVSCFLISVSLLFSPRLTYWKEANGEKHCYSRPLRRQSISYTVLYWFFYVANTKISLYLRNTSDLVSSLLVITIRDTRKSSRKERRCIRSIHRVDRSVKVPLVPVNKSSIGFNAVSHLEPLHLLNLPANGCFRNARTVMLSKKLCSSCFLPQYSFCLGLAVTTTHCAHWIWTPVS